MRPLILILALLSGQAWGATQHICATAAGSGDGSSLANCKAAGTNFAGITVGANDVLRVCDKIRGTLTVTSTNNVTVDLDCSGEASGEITGADVVTAFDAADGNGEYATTGTFSVPMWVLVDGVAWREGIKGQLADNEWAFNSTTGGTQKVFLGSNPAGRTVEIATRSRAIDFITSTGARVIGGRIYGIRYASGTAGIRFNASAGSVEGTAFYAVARPTDVVGLGSMTVDSVTVNYCGDGPDANKATDRPTLVVTDSDITNCKYQDWFANTEVSHAVTFDGESIACTDCASITATGNRISRGLSAIVTRVDSAASQTFSANWIENTVDDGISLGCTNSSGTLQARVTSNIIRDAGGPGGWGLSAYAMDIALASCGNGSDVTIAHNAVPRPSNGIRFTAAASQTGVVRHLNNVYVNANPYLVTGTHYFANWNTVSATHSLTITSDDNDYYQSAGAGAFRWVSGAAARTYANYSLFLSDSGQDSNSIRLDPLWLGGPNPTTAEGFRLSADSPLCAAGTDLGDEIADYFGDYMYNGKWDIGAFRRDSCYRRSRDGNLDMARTRAQVASRCLGIPGRYPEGL